MSSVSSSLVNGKAINGIATATAIAPAQSLTNGSPKAETAKSPQARYYQSLDFDQSKRLNKTLFRKEPHTILPKNPNGKYNKKIDFFLPDLLNYLNANLHSKNVLKGPPGLIGSAATNVLFKTDNQDIDISYTLQKNEKEFSNRNEYIELDFVLDLVRKYICTKLEIPFVNDWRFIKELDDAYLYKKKRSANGDYSYIGLGDIDLKFILKEDFRESISDIDGFQISLGEKPLACCINGTTWCATKAEFEAAQKNLACRILSVKNPEKVDDLLFRVIHRMTKCFKIEDQSALSAVAFNELVRKYPLNEEILRKYPQKYKATYDELQEKYKKHFANHYPGNPTGQYIDFLNLTSFLLSSQNNIKHPEFFNYIKLFAEIFPAKEKALIDLMVKYPGQAANLLGVAKGLLLADRTVNSNSNLDAYLFKFNENPITPRLYAEIPAERPCFLALDGSPIEQTSQFLNAWKESSEFFAKAGESAIFNQIASSLGILKNIKAFDFCQAAIDLCKAINRPPITIFQFYLFNQGVGPELFYSTLLKQFPGIDQKFVKASKVECQLSYLLCRLPEKLPTAADAFMGSLLNYMQKIGQEKDENSLNAIILALKAAVENEALDKITNHPQLSQYVNEILFEIISDAIKNKNLESLAPVQELCSLAVAEKLLTDQNTSSAACMILTACKVNELAKSPAILANMEGFIRITERWEARSNELQAESTSILTQIQQHALPIALNLLKTISSSEGLSIANEELASRCLHIVLRSPRNKLSGNGVLEAFMQFARNAFNSKKGYSLRLAFDAANSILEMNLPLKESHCTAVYQLAQHLLEISSQNMEAGVNIRQYSRFGIELLTMLANKYPENQSTISQYLLKIMGNCLILSPEDAKKDLFISFLSAYSRLKLPDEAENQVKLFDSLSFQPISAVLGNFIKFALQYDPSFALKFAEQPEIKLLMQKDDYVALQLHIISFKSKEKPIKELTHKYNIWSNLRNDLIHEQNWLNYVFGSINLLSAMTASPYKKFDKQIKKIGDVLSTILEKPKTEAFAKELCLPIANLTKNLETNRSYLAKKIKAAAQKGGILPSEKPKQIDLNHLVEKIIKSNTSKDAEEIISEFCSLITQNLKSNKSQIITENLNYFYKLIQTASPDIIWTNDLKSLLEAILIFSHANPSENEKLNGFYARLFQSLDEKKHIMVLPEEFTLDCVKKFITTSRHWKSEEIWNSLHQFYLAVLYESVKKIRRASIKTENQTESEIALQLIKENEPLFIFLDTLKEASTCFDWQLFNWVKKEIIDKGTLLKFQPSERSHAYRYLFQHFEGLCSINEPDKIKEIISLAKQLYTVCQTDINEEDRKRILDSFIKILILTKHPHNLINAVQYFCNMIEIANVETLIEVLKNMALTNGHDDLKLDKPLRFVVPAFHSCLQEHPYQGAYVSLAKQNNNIKTHVMPNLAEFMMAIISHKLGTYNAEIDTKLIDLATTFQSSEHYKGIVKELLLIILNARNKILKKIPAISLKDDNDPIIPLIKNEYEYFFKSSLEHDFRTFQEVNLMVSANFSENDSKVFFKSLGKKIIPLFQNVKANPTETQKTIDLTTKLHFLISIFSKSHSKDIRKIIFSFLKEISFKHHIRRNSYLRQMNILIKHAEENGLFNIPPIFDKTQQRDVKHNESAKIKLNIEAYCIQEMTFIVSADLVDDAFQRLVNMVNIVDFTQVDEVTLLLQTALAVHDRLLVSMLATHDKKAYDVFLTWTKNLLNIDMPDQRKYELINYSMRLLQRLISYQAIIQESCQLISIYAKEKPYTENTEKARILMDMLSNEKDRSLFYIALSKFQKENWGEPIPNLAVALLSRIHDNDKISKIMEGTATKIIAELAETLIEYICDSECSKFDVSQASLKKSPVPQGITIQRLSNIIDFVNKHLPKIEREMIIKKILSCRAKNKK